MLRIPTSKGFTVVELAVATPIVIIVMVTILGFLISLLTDFSNQRISQTLNVNGQVALQQIEADVKLSPQFLTTVDTSTFSDPYGPINTGSAWSFEGSAPTTSPYYRALILETYATTQNPILSTRAPVYLNQVGCTGDQLYTNDVLRNTVIYFIRNQTLYRRVLTDTTSATCSSPFQVQSCPTDVTYPRSSSCVTDDVELLKNVSGFNITYYSDAGSSTALTTYNLSPANPAILVNAVSADVSIIHSDSSSGSITNTATLRVTRLN
ncbi:MAG: type II secretion system protein [Candidatus Microsaccharimonas sp.]